MEDDFPEVTCLTSGCLAGWFVGQNWASIGYPHVGAVLAFVFIYLGASAAFWTLMGLRFLLEGWRPWGNPEAPEPVLQPPFPRHCPGTTAPSMAGMHSRLPGSRP